MGVAASVTCLGLNRIQAGHQSCIVPLAKSATRQATNECAAADTPWLANALHVRSHHFLKSQSRGSFYAWLNGRVAQERLLALHACHGEKHASHLPFAYQGRRNGTSTDTRDRVQVFKLFNLVPFAWGNIGWLALVAQAPKLLALVLMCAFGTSMDIMAVQAEVSEEIDTDWEVMVIGWSNVFAGIFGGGGTGAPLISF